MAENKQYVFMNGQFIPDEEATLSVRTHAFNYGTSVFEGIRGYWNEEESKIYIFRMREHYERILRSSRIMMMSPDLTIDEWCDKTVELVAMNKPKTDTYIRPIVYKMSTSIGPKLIDNPDGTIIFTCPLGQYVDLHKGLSVCVSSWRRIMDTAIPPRAKIGGSYCNAALIVSDAKLSGFDEAITLTTENKVGEGSAMNLMLVRDGVLVTSSITNDILEGITRQTIIMMAEDLGIPVQERRIDRSELYICDEAFFCGTGAQISPITKIDHRPVGDGKPGPISKKIQDLYFDVVRGKVDKYKHWCTPVDIK